MNGMNSFQPNVEGAESLKVRGLWLHGQKVPPRMKFHIWRACQNALPNCDFLQRRGVPCENVCVRCGEAFENNWHVFISCTHSASCWTRVGLHPQFFGVFGKLEMQSFGIMKSMTLWLLLIVQIIPWEIGLLLGNCIMWWLKLLLLALGIDGLHLHFGLLTCNVDASFSQVLGLTGCGICVRNHLGQLVVARTSWCAPCLQVPEGEALALLFAIQWCTSMGYLDVIFETDCKLVADSINKSRVDFSEFDSIIKECSRLLTISQNLSVRFIRKQVNGVAHYLTKAAPSMPSSQTFYHVSYCIDLLIADEMN